MGWYGYVKPKYGENAKLCYMDTNSFIVNVKKRFLQRHCRRCWNKIWDFIFWNKRPLPKEKKKKVIEVMKDALGGQIMKQFVGLREKRYSYLKDNTDEDKKAKDT